MTLVKKEKSKTQYFRLVSDQVRDNCVKEIFKRQQSSDKPIEVVIRPVSNKRSLAQNRLYWVWIHQWAEAQGWTEEYAHHFFKYKFLMMIYYRADAQYAEMCDSVKVLKEFDRGVYNKVAAHVIRQTSTTTATTAQMKEYLDKMERYCYAQDVLLMIPDELRWVRDI